MKKQQTDQSLIINTISDLMNLPVNSYMYDSLETIKRLVELEFIEHSKELSTLQDQLRWRCVEEELPENNMYILFATSDGHIRIGHYYAPNKWFMCSNSISHLAVDWLPIPRKEEE